MLFYIHCMLGRIDESQVSSDKTLYATRHEEGRCEVKVKFHLMKSKKVFTGFTIKEIGNNQEACQTRQEQNLLCNMDDEIEDFFDKQPQERSTNPDFQLNASEEDERRR